jgi:hypothetical protein
VIDDPRLTDQQLQILWEQWQPAAIEITELRARVAKLEAAAYAVLEAAERHLTTPLGALADLRAALKDAPP